MDNMKTQALKSIGSLLDIMSRKCLVEKSVSQSTLDQIINPIEKMDLTRCLLRDMILPKPRFVKP